MPFLILPKWQSTVVSELLLQYGKIIRLHNSPLADFLIPFFIYAIERESNVAVISVVFIYFACGFSAFWNVVKGSYQAIESEGEYIEFNHHFLYLFLLETTHDVQDVQ